MQDPGSIMYLLPAGLGVDRTDPAITDLQLLSEPAWEDPDPIGPAARTLLPLPRSLLLWGLIGGGLYTGSMRRQSPPGLW